ncbi:MAG: hypothetical protein KAJ44_04840 [Thermoplasmatales archaeon]|nr:hypothetical protein [Thermoplasmatales archaeon]
MRNGREKFIGKKCELEFQTGFVLRGTVDDADEAGIIFTTTQKTSFISWKDIKCLIILEDD